jgi:hypothetical protein
VFPKAEVKRRLEVTQKSVGEYLKAIREKEQKKERARYWTNLPK